MLRKLFNSLFFLIKSNKKQKVLNTQKKSTQHMSPLFSTNFKHQDPNLKTVISQKLVSDNSKDRTIISGSMLKGNGVIINHIPKDNKISVDDDILKNDDEITIIDPIEINKINNRINISYDDEVSDDDVTRLYKPKLKDQDDDVTLLYKPNI